LSTTKSYHIQRVTEMSFGSYVCIATVIGFPDASMEAILVRNQKPIMRSEKKQLATEGESGMIECYTNSIPKPTSITWSRNGQEIDYAMSGNFIKKDEDMLYGMKSVLHIASVSGTDFGMYNCTVTNSYGIAFESIKLEERHIFPTIYIIIGVIGALVIISVAFLLCFLYRKYKKEEQGSVLGSYTDTDSSSEKKRDKADSPNTLMDQLRRQDYNKDVYRFSADYDDMPYKEQSKGNNNGYGFIEPYEPEYAQDHQIFDGEYDPVYHSSLSSFRANNFDHCTPPPTMTRITPPIHMTKLATDV
jgi:hypothetical protein